MKSKPSKSERVGVYVDSAVYRRVKAILALRGQSFSRWVREKMRELVEE